jgi:hypothetical protein
MDVPKAANTIGGNMRQTSLRLKSEDRHVLENFRTKGLHHLREVNRAHILLALD